MVQKIYACEHDEVEFDATGTDWAQVTVKTSRGNFSILVTEHRTELRAATPMHVLCIIPHSSNIATIEERKL